MSDKEIPELEPGKAPFFVMGFFGLLGLFFVGLLIAVFNRGLPDLDEEAEGENPSLKNPAVLLGANDKYPRPL